MNKKELIDKLNRLGVRNTLYTLDADNCADGALVLEHELNYYGKQKVYDEWRVFYFEKGRRKHEKAFYAETEAYLEMYERLKIYASKKQ